MPRRSSSGPGDVDVVGARIAAQLLDYVVMFVLLLLFVLVAAAAFGGTGVSGEAVAFFGLLVVGLGYGTVLEGAYGKTLGKMATGIRVVDERGRDIDYGQAFIRNIPALFGGWLTWLVGVSAIAIDDRNQRLFDRAAVTYVVKDTGTGPKLTEKRRGEFTR